jgi:hypothetical protein
MISWHSVVSAWHQLFFVSSGNESLALFRMAFGFLMIMNSLLLLPDARFFFGEEGVLPLKVLRSFYKDSLFTLFRYLPDNPRTFYWVVGVQLAASAALTVGILTPLAAATMWVTSMSLCHRNPSICYGADNIFRIFSFLLIFAPAGRAFSVDSLVFHLHLGFTWVTRLMQIQVAIIYARTVGAKLKGKSWRGGTAVYYPTHIRNYARYGVPAIFDNLFILRIATWGTLALEAAIAWCIWIREFRNPVIVVGVLFHFALEFFMNVQLFGWLMMGCLLLFVQPSDVSRALHELQLIGVLLS